MLPELQATQAEKAAYRHCARITHLWTYPRGRAFDSFFDGTKNQHPVSGVFGAKAGPIGSRLFAQFAGMAQSRLAANRNIELAKDGAQSSMAAEFRRSQFQARSR